MSEVAQLLLPAVRWDATRGFAGEREGIERALSLGVGGFILFGGPADDVRALTRDLQSRSSVPLLFGADLERGAGQQFTGLTGLPPLAALASLGDDDAIRRAARLTASEARSVGINWVYGPVCDIDVEPANPIVGTRSLGGDVERVAHCAAQWVDACQAAGAMACAKHFPGHGRTTADSHAELPRVTASAEVLWATDLAPFRAAIDAGVAAVMTAHVAFPALDPSGAPATLSRPILRELLREELDFGGLVVTDAFIMEGVRTADGESSAAVRALAAGCDLLLYPADTASVVHALDRALTSGALDSEEIHLSLQRRRRWAEWAGAASHGAASAMLQSDVAWSAAAAERTVHVVRGTVPALRGKAEVLIVDDDIGGPYPPPSREPFLGALRGAGVEVREAPVGTPGAGDSAVPLIVALFGDIRGWKGRPGYSEAARSRVAQALAAANMSARDAVVVQFSHPRLAAELGDAPHIVCAWGGDRVMQEAAARVLLSRARR